MGGNCGGRFGPGVARRLILADAFGFVETAYVYTQGVDIANAKRVDIHPAGTGPAPRLVRAPVQLSEDRIYNLSVNSRRLRPGVPLLSTECRGLQCSKWSPFGARLDQILDQATAGQ
jgi:hypothetical protein